MEQKEIEDHIKNITEAVQALCDSLEKNYPGITNKVCMKGDNQTFAQRMLMGVCIELQVAGLFNKEQKE